MSNTFNIKRFWKYFVYDLNNARNNFGLSLLTLGLAPVAIFAVWEIICLAMTGEPSNFGAGTKPVIFSLLFLIYIIAAPSKLYGRLTDRSHGTGFILLPASVLEKFLSMVLITGVVLLFCLMVLFFLSDLMLGLCFPVLYGSSSFSPPSVTVFMEGDFLYEETGFGNAVTGLSTFVNILFFLLGAICIKKAKVVKTLIIFWLVSLFLVGAIFAVLAGNDYHGLKTMIYDGTFTRIYVTTVWLINIVFALALLFMIYWRLRSIKH